jgi:hypothetical protein
MKQISKQEETVRKLVDGTQKFQENVFKNLPTEIISRLKKDISINGLAQVTPADMDLMLVRMQDLFDKNMRRQEAAINQVAETRTKPSGAALTVDIDGKEYGVWHWPNAVFMPIPNGFRFPRVEVEPIFIFFTKGDTSCGIRPFMHSTFKAQLLDRVDQQYYARAKVVFQLIVRLALGKDQYDKECELRANHNVSDKDLKDIFTKGYGALVAFIDQHEKTSLHKPHLLSYMTVYDHYIKIQRRMHSKNVPAK